MNVLNIPYRVSAGGFVDHWLWAGPHATNSEGQIWKPSYLHDFQRPVEWISPLTIGRHSYPWQYLNCNVDHTLHFSGHSTQPETRRFFAYAELRQERQGDLSFELDATGQVEFWINRKQLSAKTFGLSQSNVRYQFFARVPKGRLGLFIVLTQHFVSNTACFLRFKILGEEVASRAITLPTSVNPERRKGLEEFIEATHIVKPVCGPLEPVVVQWDSDLKGQTFLGLNLSKYLGPSYMEVMHTQVNSQATYEMATAPIAAPGHYQVTVRPGIDEYYELNQRIAKVLDVHLVKSQFEQTPEQTPEERKLLAVKQAGEHASPVLRALSRAALDPQDMQDQIWKNFHEEVPKGPVDLSVVLAALTVVAQSKSALPHLAVQRQLLPVLYKALPFLKDTAAKGGSRQEFLLSVCQLALQHMLDPERSSKLNGTAFPFPETKPIHKAMRAWMARGLGGWDSQDQLAQLVTACLLLIEINVPEELQELSQILLDKALFTLVLNSWRGVFGGAGPETETSSLLDARLGAMASISYQGWGLGLPDGSHSVGISMAHSEYNVPIVIQELGLFVPEELNGEERHVWTKDVPESIAEGEEEFHRTTFKTPDFMLSSLQDFRPGQEGNRETPWQATLGYAARVHVSQPEFATEQDELPRNFWRGNVNIPRVAQCRETVVAFYGPTTRVGLGFTHAYFPQFAFDEVFISNRWAFARKNEGYLALYADNGLQAVKNGMGVGRALRSPGQENVWVCSLSRQAWDGDFDAFKGRVQQSVKVSERLVHVTPRSGETWTSGLRDLLSAAGKQVLQKSAMHYDSVLCQAPFPSKNLFIRGVSGIGLELRFE